MDDFQEEEGLRDLQKILLHKSGMVGPKKKTSYKLPLVQLGVGAKTDKCL